MGSPKFCTDLEIASLASKGSLDNKTKLSGALGVMRPTSNVWPLRSHPVQRGSLGDKRRQIRLRLLDFPFQVQLEALRKEETLEESPFR